MKWRRIRWKYELMEDFVTILPISLGTWKARDRHIFVECRDKVLFISTGYCWNGCNSVPDFPATMVASMVHDTLVQLWHCNDVPFTREDCDTIFSYLLKSHRFSLRWLYVAGVRFYTWLGIKKSGEGTLLLFNTIT